MRLFKLKNFSRTNLIRILLCIGLFLSLSTPGVTRTLSPVGEVTFIVGQARVLAGENSSKVDKNAAVHVGARFITGSNGHIHIRFIDQGFISVRPNSELLIEAYDYFPDHPKRNRILFTLTQGTARLITGKAGEASKELFRLNTPVAAVGIRGTDFLVQTDKQVSRVAVYGGAVILSGFSDTCLRDLLGACAGPLAKLLEGSVDPQYLEIKRSEAPRLVKSEGHWGKIFAPPVPDEPGVGQSGGFQNSPTQSHSLIQLRGSEQIMWGRWASQMPAGFELLGKDQQFAIFRVVGDNQLPVDGRVDMKLVQAEIFARDDNGWLFPAQTKQANLSLDFTTMKYTTQLDWVYGEQVRQLRSKGRIDSSGFFDANRSQSNMYISGGLSNDAQEASFMFLRPLPGRDAFGIVHWKR